VRLLLGKASLSIVYSRCEFHEKEKR